MKWCRFVADGDHGSNNNVDGLMTNGYVDELVSTKLGAGYDTGL